MRTLLPCSSLAHLCALLVLIASACGGGGRDPHGAPAALAGGAGLALVGPPPAPFGILSEREITWRSGPAGEYTVELFVGGSGAAGELLDEGVVEAGGIRTVTVFGTDLAFGEPAVLAIRVVDAGGVESELDVALELLPLATIPLFAGDYRDLELVASSQRIFAVEAFTGLLRVHDAAPQSQSFGALVGTLPPGPDLGPFRFDAAPGATSGFGMYGSSVLEIDLASLSIRDIAAAPSLLPLFDLALTPDGERGYLPTNGALLVLRTDANGGSPVIETSGIFDGTVVGGSVAITPAGELALVAWFSEVDFGLWIVDVDPASESFHTILADPVGPLSGPPAKVASAPSGDFAFLGGFQGTLKVDLRDGAFQLVETRPELTFDGIVVADGEEASPELVLEWTFFGPLRVLDLDLDLVGEIDVGTSLVDRAALDEAGERLFLVRNAGTATPEIAVVPLR